MDQLEKRLDKAEWTIDLHSDELKELRQEGQQMQQCLYNIQQTLSQIKWIAVGISVAYVASQIGITELIKLL